MWASRKILKVDGKASQPARSNAPAYSGTVVRLNYARHDAPNGYVRDTGDYVHVKPEGFTKLDLGIGDRVAANGDAYLLSAGRSWAMEADTVIRRAVKWRHGR